jgi:hypothetical protein
MERRYICRWTQDWHILNRINRARVQNIEHDPGGLMILNSSQIARLAYNAGFRGEALNIAVQIALAESGGNTNAYNPELAAGTPPGSGSRGLWQIYGVAHPEFNNDGAFDPVTNARAAFKVFREAGNRFTPWSTYNQGLATPQKNYAASIGGNLTPQQKKQQANQIRPNQLSNQLQSSFSGSQAGGGSGENVPANPLAGIPEAINALPQTAVKAVLGDRSGTDLTFYIAGFALVIIAVIILLIGAAGAFAGSDAGKGIIKTAVMAAA